MNVFVQRDYIKCLRVEVDNICDLRSNSSYIKVFSPSGIYISHWYDQDGSKNFLEPAYCLEGLPTFMIQRPPDGNLSDLLV